MQIGAVMFFTEYSMQPVELGRELEQREFESLWVPEHSHVPISRATPFPAGGEMPRPYYDIYDPFVALTAAAAATQNAEGRHRRVPGEPAGPDPDGKAGGLDRPGLTTGASCSASATAGTARKWKTTAPPLPRATSYRASGWKRCRRSGRRRTAEYHGEFVNFDPMMAWPKPVQQPHPPVIVGGAFPQAARRAIRYGNGWIPRADRIGELRQVLAQFRQMATEAGRDPATLPITLFRAPEDPDYLRGCRELGVSRVVFSLPAAKADELRPIMDRWSALQRQIAG